MLKKIISITSVGRFHRYISRDSDFHKMNIIYADNGRGKTTIATILRSLKSGNGQLIEGRHTIGSPHASRVNLLLDDNSKVLFENGSWDRTLPDLEVFDATFIAENVYSGSWVDHTHKRNLHRFVVGSQGVQLAREIEDLDQANRAKAEDIRHKESEIRKHIIGRLEVPSFIRLSAPSEGAIAEKEREIKLLETAEKISKEDMLSSINLPDVPWTKSRDILVESIEGVSMMAEQQVQEHVASCMDEHGEVWIEAGLKYVKNERCPFCNQPLTTAEIITAYNDYFNRAYRSFKDKIKQFSAMVHDILSEDALLSIQGTIASNNTLIEFWDDHVRTEFPKIEFDRVQDAWQNIREVLHKNLRHKEVAPLEKVEPKDDWKNAIETYHSLQEEVSNYNNILDRANRLIEAKKTEVETGDLSQSKNDLRLLRNQEKRHAPEIDELCREYAEFLEDKRDLEEQKQTAREALDQYADQIIEDYGDSINKHLCNCGAGFQIVDLSRNYRGGKPRTEYRLQIDNECINLGSQDTSIGEPSFKNTLSSGDKSALAFSLFVARLQQYPESELRNKIVVFDDPFSSLDAQRKGYTCRQIIWFAEKCAQVIVLTHNLPLARSVWDKSKWLNPQTLEIVRKAENYSDIERLEMLERTKSAYFQHYETLQKYLEEGLGDGQSLLSIATSIRPLLEGYLRMRFPQELKVNEWLGDFVGKLRDAEEGSPLYDIRSEILNELTDINDYSKKYHHDQNRNAAEEPITDTELCTYVDRTLRLIR